MVTGVGDGVWSCTGLVPGESQPSSRPPSLGKGRACVATQNQTFL